MEPSSNPEEPTELADVQPEPVAAEVVPEQPATEPIGDDVLISGELAPKLTIEDAEPDVPDAPDLAAVEPPAPAAPAPAPAPSLDLPSLELPHGGDYTENVARSAYAQPEPQQAPPAAAYQTPYAVPEPAAQPPYGQPPQYGQPQYGQQQYGQPQQQYGQPQQQQYGQQLVYPGSQLNATDESTWSSAAHWSAILASFVGLGFLGPLLVLLVQGPKSARVRANAVESLNFEITFIIAMVVSVLAILLLVGIVTTILLPLAWLILRILAAVRTSAGEDYRYPVNIRLVK